MLVALEGHEPPNLKPSHLTTHAFSTWSCLNPAAEGYVIIYTSTNCIPCHHGHGPVQNYQAVSKCPGGHRLHTRTAAHRSPQRIPIRTRSTRTPLRINHSPINRTTNQHGIGLKHRLNHYCTITAPINPWREPFGEPARSIFTTEID